MKDEEYTRMHDLEDRYWWFVGRRNQALRLLRTFTSNQARPRILDLGCGTGVISGELESWSEPISLDMSILALNFSKHRGVKRLLQARGEWLPIETGSVDAVLALDIFEHIEDDAKAFAEAYRALKPGGVLVLSVPAFKSLWGPHDVALMHFRRYKSGQMRRRLEEAGFKIRRMTYAVFFLFPIVVFIRFFEKRKKGEATASLPKVPDWFNTLLIGLQNFEAWVMSRASLPWGSSVIAVAQKPAGSNV